MNNRNSKKAIRIAVLFEIIIIITAVSSVVTKEWKDIALLCLASGCIILPFFITKVANKINIKLPSSFQIGFILFSVLALYLGEIKKFYIAFWWWDLFLHAIFGSYMVIIALHLTKGIIIKDKEVTEKKFIIFNGILAFNFSVALGTLWEAFEFLGDYFFKTTMIKGGIEDTLTDLIVKIMAAFITSIIYYYGNLRKVKVR